MSQLMQLKDVAESTRLGPLSGEVSAGEILHLVGPNGAGKSTLLARMAGLTSGEGEHQVWRSAAGGMGDGNACPTPRLSCATAKSAVRHAGLALPDIAST